MEEFTILISNWNQSDIIMCDKTEKDRGKPASIIYDMLGLMGKHYIHFNICKESEMNIVGLNRYIKSHIAFEPRIKPMKATPVNSSASISELGTYLSGKEPGPVTNVCCKDMLK